MGIYRVFAGSDGESHIEELRLEEHPELGALTNINEVRVQQFDGTRKRDFNPLPEESAKYRGAPLRHSPDRATLPAWNLHMKHSISTNCAWC
jgi:hypothetical protein